MPSTSLEYVADRVFNLNFEDHRKSVTVRIGDSVLFDGRIATHVKSEIKGVAPSLGKAIQLGWLNKAADVPATVTEAPTAPIAGKDGVSKASGPAYDNLRGGSFDDYIAKEFDPKVVKDEDLVVKKTKTSSEIRNDGREKLEVAGDQVEVGTIHVSSSTATVKDRKHGRQVIASEQFGAEASIPIKMKNQAKEEKKANVFTVDDKTPSIPDGATKAEVDRILKVEKADESQEAKVIKKIKNDIPDVVEMDGVVLKRPDTTPREFQEPVAKVGSPYNDGSDVGLEQGGVVVKRIGEKGPAKKLEVEPQEARVVGRIGQKREAPKAKKADSQKPAEKKTETEETPVNKKSSEEGDYLSQLPEDWGKLHWVKKEKFIFALTDIGFIKFIMTVETLNAVQNACKKRLEELEKQGNSK